MNTRKKPAPESPGFRPGRHYHDEFDHLVSPLGRDGAETPAYSPEECIDYKVPSNQPHDGPHEPFDIKAGRPESGSRRRRSGGSEFQRNEVRRG